MTTEIPYRTSQTDQRSSDLFGWSSSHQTAAAETASIAPSEWTVKDDASIAPLVENAMPFEPPLREDIDFQRFTAIARP